MARLVVERDGDREEGTVTVRLSWREALLARRMTVRVPLSCVAEAGVEPDWWRALRGTPVVGRCRPGRSCVGEREHTVGRDFVAVRAGVPVAVLDLRPPAPFARLAVSVPDADAIAAAVRPGREAEAEGRPEETSG